MTQSNKKEKLLSMPKTKENKEIKKMSVYVYAIESPLKEKSNILVFKKQQTEKFTMTVESN